MQKFILFILLFGFTIATKASGDNQNAGARSAALGNASVSISDLWSVQNNQAGLAFLEKISAGVFYENRFMLKQTAVKATAAVLPLKQGVFGISMTSFGYASFTENKYGLSFAKAFGPAISAGIQFDYINTKIAENYGSTGIPVVEMGLQTKPLKNLTIGAHIYNPTRAKFADYNDERIPTIMRLGMNYQFSNKIFIAIETEKNIALKSVIKAGIEYQVTKEFYLRTGISTNPAFSSFGFGLHLRQFKLDFSSSYHSVLGFSPQVGMNYELK